MAVIATAGHVDHGKSTLLRALTGQEPDRGESERRRGLTIDLGFVSAEVDGGSVMAFVDVPGHRRFVPNMLAGVGPVPAVLFVVAADDGWMPQSQEHLDALAALGVDRGVLAITRADLMDPEFALDEARSAMAGTPLAGIPAVAVSAVSGRGLHGLRSALTELAAGLPCPDRDADVRLWVDRSFTIGGAGTVVTGTLGAGTVRVGDVLAAGGRRVRVRGLQSLGRETRAVSATARVAVNLRGIAADDVSRGTALVAPGRWRETRRVDARIEPGARTADRLPEGMIAHCGSASTSVRVRSLLEEPDAPLRWARLTLADPLPLRVGDRLILRDPGAHRIPAGAVVLDPAPPELTRRGDARRRSAVLAGLPDVPSLRSELARRSWVHVDDLRVWGIPVPEPAGAYVLEDAAADRLAAKLAAYVDEDDLRDPLEPGVSEEDARRRLGLPDAGLLAAVLACHGAAGLVSEGGRIMRDGRAGLPDAVLRSAETLGRRFAGAPFVAPTAGELDELGLGRRELAACERAGILTRIGAGVWLGADAIERAAATLRELPAPFTPSQARAGLGTSRRVMMPLLELLAARGLTRRDGDGGHEMV